MDTLILINNYLHDFFAAGTFVSLLTAIYFGKLFARLKTPKETRVPAAGFLFRLAWISLAMTCLLGIPRTLDYIGTFGREAHELEYGMMAVKHMVLFGVVATLFVFAYRSQRK